eukprot:scaffold89818_cov16-Prasinocladus_malaysianus.AAC.1
MFQSQRLRHSAMLRICGTVEFMQLNYSELLHAGIANEAQHAFRTLPLNSLVIGKQFGVDSTFDVLNMISDC